ncbi:Hypothetical predicted protein [Marmota monax]|nr:hypothetical protein GHT09_002337 [Marmota monax]VTJ58238.1 Hypothetical predicted protein [Marmota monax]
MVRTEHAFQLIRKELVEEFDQPKGGETSPAADSSPSLNREEVIKLLSIFESRLSFLLLQSIKLLSSTKKKTSNNIEEDGLLKSNKQIYSQLLRATANKSASLLERIDVIIHLLGQLAHGGSGVSSGAVQ